MTIILTQISKYGIIHASDSAATITDLTNNTKTTKKIQKTFRVNYLKAGLTVAGSGTVGGISIDKWMNEFIQNFGTQKDKSLQKFAYCLRDSLDKEMGISEKCSGSIIQLAGYVEKNGASHPEFYHIKNLSGPDETSGEYDVPLDHFFPVEEQFWNACADNKLIEKLQSGFIQIYVNGLTEGRVSHNVLIYNLDEYYKYIWSNPNSKWKFRSPNSITEHKLLIKLNLQTIINLFKISDYDVPYIGGPVQIITIKQPKNCVIESLYLDTTSVTGL